MVLKSNISKLSSRHEAVGWISKDASSRMIVISKEIISDV